MMRGKSGELMPEQIGAIWLETQREAPGRRSKLPDGTDYAIFWSHIPHFIHVPFYVYAYAFGDCLVNSLYAVYQNAPGRLRAEIPRHAEGGAPSGTAELLAPFGLDAADPGFWSRVLASSAASSTSWRGCETGWHPSTPHPVPLPPGRERC